MRKTLPRLTVIVRESMQRKAFQVWKTLPPRILEFNARLLYIRTYPFEIAV
jgi:hypothetical protein